VDARAQEPAGQVGPDASATVPPGELSLQSEEFTATPGESIAISDEVAPVEHEPQLELSLDKIVRAWSVILNQVKKKKIPLYSLLQEARPIELEGRVLTLGFPVGAEFHKAQAEKPNYIEVVTDVLMEMTGSALNVKCVVAESDEITAAPPERDNDTPSAEDVIAMIKAELDAEEIP